MADPMLASRVTETGRSKRIKLDDGGQHRSVSAENGLASKLANANPLVCAMLTDYYQITMGYAYWKAGKMNDSAVFDLYFRKNPFKGEFTLYAGLEECIRFLATFKFTKRDTEFLKSRMPTYIEQEFFDYLETLDGSQVSLYSQEEGTVVFPKVPLLRVCGPLLLVQLLETPFLTMVNFASLVCTNAMRHRIAVGTDIQLLEFGLRRAQGPDGGLSASRYCYLGGFDATSNVLAGQMFDIPIKGTHAHAFVTSYAKEDADARHAPPLVLKAHTGDAVCENFLKLVLEKSAFIISNSAAWGHSVDPNSGELAAFASYAHAFPDGFLALVDTYNVMKSGLPNFVAVVLALRDLGYHAVGVRLDSGDLAYLSKACRQYFRDVSKHVKDLEWLAATNIVASNDINEETLYSLQNQGHEINTFGVGTHLVTCQAQPALGCVFKLVALNDEPRIKLSEDVEKVNLPGSKDAFRLYGKDGAPLIDLLSNTDEPPPTPGKRILCRHPFIESKRAYVVPAKIEKLHHLFWDRGVVCRALPDLDTLRQRARASVLCQRPDHIRALNPTPYKVSVTEELYSRLHRLWLTNAPVTELS
eukprot:m.1136509 g.1136509  ORF g.1136509 m.1136509 type:complete len:586 (-) comp24433_c0_seq1:2537-4294(-)